jgi:hypothetical protein
MPRMNLVDAMLWPSIWRNKPSDGTESFGAQGRKLSLCGLVSPKICRRNNLFSKKDHQNDPPIVKVFVQNSNENIPPLYHVKM